MVMDREHRRSSETRKWWLLLGGFVLFLVAFQLLEDLISPAPLQDADAAPSPAPSPAPPELRRTEDGAIEIRHDLFQQTTIRLGDEEDSKALFDCLEQGFENAFGEGTEGWTRRRVRLEAERIQNACLGSAHGLPVPPRPPNRDALRRPGDGS